MRYRQIKSHKAGLSSRPLNKYIQQMWLGTRAKGMLSLIEPVCLLSVLAGAGIAILSKLC